MSPWIPGAVRAYLLADPTFNTAAGGPGRVGTRLPPDMSTPFVQIRVPGNNVLTAAFARSPLVQIDPWVPDGGSVDPEQEAADLAELAGSLLDRARNVAYQTMSWSGRWLDGPTQPHVDTSRGNDFPLYGAPIRVELKTHTR
jgi:hypothetical protein